MLWKIKRYFQKRRYYKNVGHNELDLEDKVFEQLDDNSNAKTKEEREYDITDEEYELYCKWYSRIKVAVCCFVLTFIAVSYIVTNKNIKENVDNNNTVTTNNFSVGNILGKKDDVGYFNFQEHNDNLTEDIFGEELLPLPSSD